MKFLVLALLALVATCNAGPSLNAVSQHDSRFVDQIVASALEALSQQLRDAGLDPWHFDKFGADLELPVPVLFSVNGYVDDLQITGISNIVINSINYGILSSRLTMDISLPEIAITIGDAAFDLTILGGEFSGRTSSRLTVIEPRISGVVQLNVGIITGIFVRDIDLEFDLGGIQFDGSLNLFGAEYSGVVNELVSQTIPNALTELRAEVNELVEIIAWLLIDMLL